ncbi:MAG: carboxypeptidase regulatory-like domain-containing protein [Bryobacterales bacterium]|nr:carboxypeptidase regulatory-like domain-containing protein [Bryobacterales bacterium]
MLGDRGRFFTFLLFSLVLMVSHPGYAQKSSGELVGTVTDTSGAALVDVLLTAVNVDTNELRQAQSDQLGSYRFLFLPPGMYTLTAELESFRTASVENLSVQVDQQRRQDVVLEVGQVTETITVEAEAVTVNSESASLGSVVEQRRVVELPLNGRSFISLAYLNAGTVNPSVGNVESVATGLSGGRPSVAVSITGMREGSNDILFDGIPNKHNFYSSVGTLPAPESIAEFKVQQGYFSPEYGLPAVTNVVTKSGTNEFHGTLWEFFRNDKLDARNAFAREKSPDRQNQYGGVAGLPIVKDKLFFFGSYEGLARRRSFTGGRAVVPTPDMINGDFSALLPDSQIFDPRTYDAATDTRQPFPNNRIPNNQFDDFANRYIAAGMIAEPTAVTDGAFNRVVTTPFTQDDFKFSLRSDWNASESDRVFGRVSISESDQIRGQTVPFNNTESPFDTRNIVIGWTKILSPTMINNFRFGEDRALLNTNGPENAVNNPDWPTALGLTGLSEIPECNGAPSVAMSGFNAFGFTFQNCIITENDNFHVVDNFAVIKGKHSLNFGGQFVRVRLKDIAGFTQTGRIAYTGQFSGNAVSDFLLGAPFTATGGTTRVFIRRGLEWNAYVNDNYKATQNLTLNMGLRYQYTSPFVDVDDLAAIFDYATGRVNRCCIEGRPRNVIQKDFNDLAPRFGFAWSPGGSRAWALRGSYGIYYDRIPGNDLAWTGLFPPAVTGQSFTSDQKVPTIDTSTLFPVLVGDDPNEFQGTFLFNLADRRSPYIQQWTLSIQRTLPGQIFAEAAYVGSKGTKLSKRVDSNVAPLPDLGDTRPLEERRPYPQWSFILDDRGFSNSSYHGLLLTLKKSYSHGLIFQSSYTFAKSLDNDSYDSKATRNYFLADLDKARSIHDIRHNFVFSINYELPFGKSLQGAPRFLLQGWEVNSIVNAQTGGPMHVRTNADPSDTGAIFNHYPNRICDGNIPNGTRERWFDTSCFELPAFRTYGNAGVHYLNAPGYTNWDFSLNKMFTIREDLRIQFRSEFFNMLNATNLGRPNTTFESPNFGRITSAGMARVIQFGLKLYW